MIQDVLILHPCSRFILQGGTRHLLFIRKHPHVMWTNAQCDFPLLFRQKFRFSPFCGQKQSDTPKVCKQQYWCRQAVQKRVVAMKSLFLIGLVTTRRLDSTNLGCMPRTSGGTRSSESDLMRTPRTSGSSEHHFLLRSVCTTQPQICTGGSAQAAFQKYSALCTQAVGSIS